MRILYIVGASVDSEETADAWVEWVRSGHAQGVIEGGALSAAIHRVQRDSPGPVQIEVHYLFAGIEAFETYLSSSAPALRAEGLRRFPPESGVRLNRRLLQLETEIHKE